MIAPDVLIYKSSSDKAGVINTAMNDWLNTEWLIETVKNHT